MSRIRSHSNKDTELALIQLFKKNHIVGWRRRWPLLGKPDFVFPAARLAVFVDGCFWHGCKAHSKAPKTNCEYWNTKLLRNRKRDKMVRQVLRKQQWNVLRLWEHELIRTNEEKMFASYSGSTQPNALLITDVSEDSATSVCPPSPLTLSIPPPLRLRLPHFVAARRRWPRGDVFCRYWRSAFRRMPMPLPWTMRTRVRPARKARSMNFSTSLVASSTLRPITFDLRGGIGIGIFFERDGNSSRAGRRNGIQR